MTQREELRLLIEQSISIDASDRKRFLSGIDKFSDDEVDNLLKVFRFEKNQVAHEEYQFETKKQAIDNDFRALIQDFKLKKYPEALKKIEGQQKAKDDAVADSLLQDIDS